VLQVRTRLTAAKLQPVLKYKKTNGKLLIGTRQRAAMEQVLEVVFAKTSGWMCNFYYNLDLLAARFPLSVMVPPHIA
jgi:hypothetical protein